MNGVTERESNFIDKKIDNLREDVQAIRLEFRGEFKEFKEEFKELKQELSQRCAVHNKAADVHDERLDDLEKKYLEHVTAEKVRYDLQEKRSKLNSWIYPLICTAVFSIIAIILKFWK